jgi:hypothetical protein
MPHYVYPDSLLTALHRGNVNTALLAHNIGGRMDRMHNKTTIHAACKRFWHLQTLRLFHGSYLASENSKHCMTFKFCCILVCDFQCNS